MTAPILGIDLGTTHTVAALTGADGRAQPLLFDASFLLPSAVYAQPDGRLLVGRDAERSARLDPARFEPNPKRRVDDGTVLLGNREYPVADLLAALLRRVGDEAARVAGALPTAVVLTHPANWAASRRAVLTEAAERAGLPGAVLVPEPVAAAYYFTTSMGYAVPPGGNLVVYDFGGGTFDTSVLRRGPDLGWDVLVSDGLYDLGGVDLDGAIVEHLGRSLAMRDAALWHRLREPADDGARRRLRLLQEEARAAKEQLSRSSSAAVPVPLFETDVVLMREEFEQLARPYLQRTVDLTAATLQRAGVRPDQVGGLFLVGGSSRVPLVSTLLFQRLGVAPTLIEQPELVVALGSVLAAPAVPVSGPAGPGIPVSGLPVSAGPHPGMPVSGPPVAAAAQQAGPMPFGAPPPLPVWPPSGPGVDGPFAPPAAPGGRRPLALIAGLVAFVLLLCVAGGVAAQQLLASHTTANAGSSGGHRTSGSTPGSVNSNDLGGAVNSPAAAGGSHQSATINRSAWYIGLKLTFQTAQYDGTKSHDQLSADVLVENIAADTESAYLPIVFSSGDVQAEARGQMSDVQAGTKLTVTYTFDVPKMKSGLADGLFLVGKSGETVAVVPVGDKNKDKYKDLQPRRVLTNQGFDFRDLKINYNLCDVRGGYPDQSGQAKQGYLMVYCDVDLQYTGTSGGGILVDEGMFHLGLPDGTEVAPVHMRGYDPGPGQKVPNISVPFQVKQPVAGTYQLRVIDVALGEKRTPDKVHDTPLVIP